jgi:NADH-quinone oxidoreductase subunit G
MIPTLTNSLGVALINELSDEVGSYAVGYNVKADFTLSALGDGDLDMPAINQQEGTLTSINKRVNPTNAAIGYNGYVLNDIANALGFDAELTVDYTAELPVDAGFKAEAFDDLPNHYTNAGEEIRGYVLDAKTRTVSDENVAKIDESLTLGDNLVYMANPVRQFNAFTNKATQLDEESGLYISEENLEDSDFKQGDKVRVKTENGEIITTIVSDNKIAGDIALVPTFDTKLNSESLFSGYRFTTASIEKV